MNHTVYRDAITLILVGFVAMVIWMLPYLNPVAESATIEMPGSLAATITWPESDTDVDLWMDGPAEPVPVGYSNKGGILWNLLRDDLGKQPDYMSANFENAFTRGMPPGKYRLNVHCYRCPQLPVEVKLEVIERRGTGFSVVARSTITLRRNHEEKTGLAFVVGPTEQVDMKSLNTVFEPLRSGSK